MFVIQNGFKVIGFLIVIVRIFFQYVIQFSLAITRIIFILHCTKHFAIHFIYVHNGFLRAFCVQNDAVNLNDLVTRPKFSKT